MVIYTQRAINIHPSHKGGEEANVESNAIEIESLNSRKSQQGILGTRTNRWQGIKINLYLKSSLKSSLDGMEEEEIMYNSE